MPRKRMFFSRPLAWITLLAILLLAGASTISAQDDDNGEDAPVSQFEGDPDLALPPFPEGLEWINVDGPLTLEDLRGKILIFDFWTYGCINCIHMIPVLEELEQKYPDELVVIGVHSAKFDNEGQTENIRQIVQRYDITHPVINDSERQVWSSFGVRAWPTFVVADPRGNVLAAQSGEIPFEAFDGLVGAMVEYWDSIGELDRSPIEISPEGADQPARLLDFPGKVLVDAEGGRLFIADSGHHRIVIADLATFEVLDVIGTGQRGYDNGSFDDATFNQPHGMALHNGILYIADVKNHTIRSANLAERTVDVLAGTGEMGQGGPLPFGTQIREPRAYQLRSPWDVEMGAAETLFIAHAGTHQIFEINLETNVLRASVGNGREANRNASLGTSELAQPSGLYFEAGLLYFADSESSTIRVADYENDAVTTVSGTTADNLFDYGDIDGPVGTSRLQHALGVDGDGEGLIYIADTYNSRIKVVDATMTTETIYGLGGSGGFADGGADAAQFDEPGGLDYHDGRLYVADTNNHAIRIIDLAAGEVSTVRFPNPQRLQIAERLTIIGGADAADAPGDITLETQVVAAGPGTLTIEIALPEGYKLNDLAPSTARLRPSGDAVALADADALLTFQDVALAVPLSFGTGEGSLTGEIEIYYCEAINETLCFVDAFRIEVPLAVGDDGETALSVTRTVEPPQIEGLGGF